MFSRFSICLILVSVITSAQALVWPTANTAFVEGKGIESFVQATVSGNPTSGLYGCVRNDGEKFHEGLDLFGLKRGKDFEALDSIYSVLPGRVVYINEASSRSSYGRSLVIEHKDIGVTFYSLYAHLHSVDPSVHLGSQLKEGQRIARMGRTAGGYTIPKERAHLHFELGLKLSDNFQSWYDSKDFDSKNWHSNWNGMNLIGVDPLDFYKAVQAGSIRSFAEYLGQLKARVKVQVRFNGTPSFLAENSKFLKNHSLKDSEIVGWNLTFSKYGVPNLWEPISQEGLRLKAGQRIAIIAYNKKELDQDCCALFLNKNGVIRPSNLLISNIEKLLIRSIPSGLF